MSGPNRLKAENARASVPSDLSACEALFAASPAQPLKDSPKKIRQACGDAYFPIDTLKDFDLRIGRGLGSVKVRSGGQLMKRQATYQLGRFFFSSLRNPEPGLRFILQELHELSGKDKIKLVLEPRVSRGNRGWFIGIGRRQEIHLADTFSTVNGKPKEMGSMDVSTLYHELGHNLRYLLYGKKIPHYGGPSHDLSAVRDWEEQTTPSAAWSEGFAGAIGNLDYRKGGGISDPSQLFPAWFEMDLEERLSNEEVIAAILTEYIKSLVPYRDTKMMTTALDEASYCRLRKIFATMRAEGLQKNFAVFVSDFLRRYPEEGERLNPILRDFGMGELASDAEKFEK